jgi:hypothetical protein
VLASDLLIAGEEDDNRHLNGHRGSSLIRGFTLPQAGLMAEKLHEEISGVEFEEF